MGLFTIEPDGFEFQAIFYMTIAVMVLKIILILYMAIRIIKAKKAGGALSQNFIFAIFVMLMALFISRIFYMIFDFGYTKFNMDLYYLNPQVWFWKIGQFIAGLGQTYLVYVVDKKILNKKYKGLLALFMLVAYIALFIAPIYNEASFTLVSALFIIPTLGLAAVIVIFLNIGRKSTGQMKRNSYIMFFGMLFYAIAALVVNAGIISAVEPLYPEIDLIMYTIQTTMKFVALLLLTYAATKFYL